MISALEVKHMTQKLLGYSKQLLVDALFELMEYKKFQEITIKELAEKQVCLDLHFIEILIPRKIF